MGDADRPLSVAIVEDDANLAKLLGRSVTNVGHPVEIFGEAAPVLARLEHDDPWGVILLDIELPDTSGLAVLHKCREVRSHASVIMLTADATAATATECLRAGAFHYLTKPAKSEEVLRTIALGARYASMREGIARTSELASPLVGTSAPIKKLRETVALLGKQAVSVLIVGESGTGKELVARTLHESGPRGAGPFVAVNCGAIPESLIDSELFGHAKGAFTGAVSDRPGVFVEANEGTLFLDEIGDMPLAVQARLLRVLQEGEVRAVGSSGVREVDVRVIAATHVDLAAAVEQGQFRRDLFYRLNVVALSVPPLRDRLDDLPLLISHFLRKYTRSTNVRLSPEALDRLARHGWPGNIRELENALLHAIAFRRGDVIEADALPLLVNPRVQGSQPLRIDEGLSLTEAKRKATIAYEREYLVYALERAKGSISEAARLSGIDRTNFKRLLQRHNIDPNAFK